MPYKLALEIDPNIQPEQLKQDEDVLDTWFSSWLWPISVFDGITKPNNEDIKYYYPTNDLVTAPEILFFWVARMIIAGYEYMGEAPFKNVYLHGIVRDAKRRKMSKSLGNSPNPLDLVKQYGADGVRTGMLFSAPAGNDLLFDEKLCEQGRNFTNKVWNALRLVKGWEIDDSLIGTKNEAAIAWFESRFNEVLAEMEDHFSKYRISDALMSMYKLVWDDFCSWYLEMVKPDYQKPIDRDTYNDTVAFIEKLMQVVHPFMPFISEEVWHAVKERSSDECIVVSAYPKPETVDASILEQAQLAFEIITSIRNTKNAKQLPPKTELPLFVKTRDKDTLEKFAFVIKKLAFVSSIEFVDKPVDNAANFVVKQVECYLDIKDSLDPEAEKEKILKEIEYTKGFLKSIEKKLSNEKFVNGAPEAVVQKERKKQEDGENTLKALEAALENLG